MYHQFIKHTHLRFPSYQAQLYSWFFHLLSSPKRCRWMGNGWVLSVQNASCLAPSSHSCPAPVWEPSHKPQFAALAWVLSMGAVLQKQTAPARVPHRPQFPWENLLLHGLLSTQPQFPPGTHTHVGFPQAAASFKAVHRLHCGYPLHHGLPWTSGGQPAPPWSSPLAAGERWILVHGLFPGQKHHQCYPALHSQFHSPP